LATILLKCEYDHQFHLQHIEESMNYYATMFAQAQGDESALQELQVDFYSHVTNLCTFFKHPKFGVEEEWRVAIRHWKQEEDVSGRLVRSTQLRLTPYREFLLARDKQQLLFRQLVIGPCSHMDLAEEAASIAVKEHKAHCEEYRRSEIPYRDW
ncbi:MAG: hypothetical protein ABJC26_00015, partial [Gemmatimonadaceae bacterium]